MKKALEMNIKGIKCDNCDYRDEDVKFEDYKEWLNKPCPLCGENLLTKADYDSTLELINLVNFMNSILPAPGPDEQLATMSVEMNGSGKVEFGDIELI